MRATFDRFEVWMTRSQAEAASHVGECWDDARAVAEEIAPALNRLDPEDVRAELREFGAWDDVQLSDNAENRVRLTWIAAGNIREEMRA